MDVVLRVPAFNPFAVNLPAGASSHHTPATLPPSLEEVPEWLAQEFQREVSGARGCRNGDGLVWMRHPTMPGMVFRRTWHPTTHPTTHPTRDALRQTL